MLMLSKAEGNAWRATFSPPENTCSSLSAKTKSCWRSQSRVAVIRTSAPSLRRPA